MVFHDFRGHEWPLFHNDRSSTLISQRVTVVAIRITFASQDGFSAEDDSRFKMAATEKSIQARRYLVRGRVQGVGFRWFVEREAHMLGIAGWVRNNHDGSVEVLAQGTRDQLSGLHSRLREGPRAARVDAVEVTEAQPQTGLTTFRIEGAW